MTVKLFCRNGIFPSERNLRHSIDICQGAAIGRDERKQPATLDLSRRAAVPIRRFLRQRGRVMLITICRLYDSYIDANRVVLAIEAAGVPPPETTGISNNSDTWNRAAN